MMFQTIKDIIMIEGLKSLFANHRDLKEIDALSERDLDELGLTRDQLRRIALMPRGVGERMTAMAAIFGVDADDLQEPRATYADLLETCYGCTKRKACAVTLANPEAVAKDCGFCPNADAFALL